MDTRDEEWTREVKNGHGRRRVDTAGKVWTREMKNGNGVKNGHGR